MKEEDIDFQIFITSYSIDYLSQVIIYLRLSPGVHVSPVVVALLSLGEPVPGPEARHPTQLVPSPELGHISGRYTYR